MGNPSLWWFVSLGDGKYEYRMATHDAMVADFNSGAISLYVVVHPDNPMYGQEYRQYNSEYDAYIAQCRVQELKRLLDIEAPAVVIASDQVGVFSRSANVLVDG